jgi:N utilization substance protein B
VNDTAGQNADKGAEKKSSTAKRVPLANRRKARKLIMQATYQWLLSENDPLDIARQFHEDTHGKIDWEYFDEIFRAIPKHAEELEALFLPLLDRNATALDPIEKSLLFLGTYELAHRIDIPYRVVINECIELAKTFGATESHKYINGVLDKLAPQLRVAETQARP